MSFTSSPRSSSQILPSGQCSLEGPWEESPTAHAAHHLVHLLLVFVVMVRRHHVPHHLSAGLHHLVHLLHVPHHMPHLMGRLMVAIHHLIGRLRVVTHPGPRPKGGSGEGIGPTEQQRQGQSPYHYPSHLFSFLSHPSWGRYRVIPQPFEAVKLCRACLTNQGAKGGET